MAATLDLDSYPFHILLETFKLSDIPSSDKPEPLVPNVPNEIFVYECPKFDEVDIIDKIETRMYELLNTKTISNTPNNRQVNVLKIDLPLTVTGELASTALKCIKKWLSKQVCTTLDCELFGCLHLKQGFWFANCSPVARQQLEHSLKKLQNTYLSTINSKTSLAKTNISHSIYKTQTPNILAKYLGHQFSLKDNI